MTSPARSRSPTPCIGSTRIAHSYDRPPFDVRVESTDDASPLAVAEVVSIATVWRRAHARPPLSPEEWPPYEAVLFFPGALAIGADNSANLQLNTFGIDFIVLSGRALGVSGLQIHLRAEPPTDHVVISPADARLHHLGAAARGDARRSLDYLETRSDIDAARLAFYGLSWGGQLGPIIMALDPRIKAGVLLMGGQERPVGA